MFLHRIRKISDLPCASACAKEPPHAEALFSALRAAPRIRPRAHAPRFCPQLTENAHFSAEKFDKGSFFCAIIRCDYGKGTDLYETTQLSIQSRDVSSGGGP